MRSLNERQKQEIIRRYLNGEQAKPLAKEFSRSPGYIYNLIYESNMKRNLERAIDLSVSLYKKEYDYIMLESRRNGIALSAMVRKIIQERMDEQ